MKYKTPIKHPQLMRHGAIAACIAICGVLVFAASTITRRVNADWTSPAALVTTEGGSPVTIDVHPNVSAAYGGTIHMLVMPDRYTDVGRGPGITQTIDATSVDGRWQLAERWDGDGTTQRFADNYTLHILALDDDEVQGEHQSTITIAYRCDTDMSLYPPHTTRTTIVNTITDNDAPGAITGTPVGDGPAGTPCLVPETAGTLGQASETIDPPTAGTPNSTEPQLATVAPEEPSVATAALLNESKNYASGTGETASLKPNRGVRFVLGTNTADEHHVTVLSVGDGEATIVIASDPIQASLKQGDTKKFDVNKNGKDDIEVTLVDITDGAADLLFRPVSSESKVYIPKTTVLDTTGTARRGHAARSIAAGGAAILVATGAGWYLWYRRRARRMATLDNAKRAAPGRTKPATARAKATKKIDKPHGHMVQK